MEIDQAETERLRSRYFQASKAEDPLDKAMYQDLKMYLPDDILALSDRLSMHHSLELRVPFVDHKFVEFCATYPSSLKIQRFKKKYLLKKVVGAFLPGDVIHHRKQGFASPMASWLRNDLKNYATDLPSEPNLHTHGYFKTACVKKILGDHFDRKESNDKLIFSLMISQKWFQIYS